MPIREHALSEAYAAADRALYRAKTAGRARLCVEAHAHAA
jgi:PleD family two-component response regulator